MKRKEILATEEIYHIFTKSIADFRVFNNEEEFLRIKQLIKYYQIKNELRFSDFIELRQVQQNGFDGFLNTIASDKDKSVQILAYCFMPTHIHLILKQLVENGIPHFTGNVLNGYTRYFNIKHKRKGPLWEGKFKNVLVTNGEQLLHLTRYIHLNPVTASLVTKPEEWAYSSYKEYLLQKNNVHPVCQFDDILEIEPSSYRKFVNDQIAYQKELAKIRKLLVD